eukprot:2704354-Rhodomonas_salina.2
MRRRTLLSYATATECPVLTYGMLLPGADRDTPKGVQEWTAALRACYGMSGTELGYAATRFLRPTATNPTMSTCFTMVGACVRLMFSLVLRWGYSAMCQY